MEPTSNQPYTGSATPSHSNANQAFGTSSHADSQFSTTAAHATGQGQYPTDYTTNQPAADGVQGALNSALASGKQWLADSGLADQAQQLPQAAKDLGAQAWTRISGLSNTQKAVGVGLLAAGIALLATRNKSSHDEETEYRHKSRRSPFDKNSRADAGEDYSPRGAQQRPWGSSRYGAGNPRVSSGSGYASSHQHGADYGSRAASSDYSTSVGGNSYGSGQRRDQGPASGSRYDAKTSGSQNPNNLDQLNSAY
ncbi:hypothetical protein [Hymenobacter sp. BRD67]|uniref:hypothetical protein n=1 Tax=Hymenobacter sp. BRD67 TaxID=2675877 RepID=UPI001564A73E|nr:hypothetical protein [Hymenobacter sp. BRD67]QKG54003.1 hypothetical protein GKZ67_17075 [Hymenobacter sp. BRD67]